MVRAILLSFGLIIVLVCIPFQEVHAINCACQIRDSVGNSTIQSFGGCNSCSENGCGIPPQPLGWSVVMCFQSNETNFENPETCEIDEAGNPDPACVIQLDSDGKPVTSDGKPITSDGKPVTSDGKPITSGGQTSDPKFVAPVKLNNPITGAPSTGSGIELISQVVKNVINTLLGLVGIFAMIGFIWGGVTWMTSYGDTAKIERGKKMMTWGVVGLVVIFSSYAITNYIFQAIGATGAATTVTSTVDPENDPARLLEPLR